MMTILCITQLGEKSNRHAGPSLAPSRRGLRNAEMGSCYVLPFAGAIRSRLGAVPEWAEPIGPNMYVNVGCVQKYFERKICINFNLEQILNLE
jgi:hypothetical protein